MLNYMNIGIDIVREKYAVDEAALTYNPKTREYSTLLGECSGTIYEVLIETLDNTLGK